MEKIKMDEPMFPQFIQGDVEEVNEKIRELAQKGTIVFEDDIDDAMHVNADGLLTVCYWIPMSELTFGRWDNEEPPSQGD